MKSWLAKFRISNAIDAGKPLPARLRRKLERDPELRAFAETTARIERGLRQSPEPELPPCAHDAIMRAIKAAQPQPRATAPFQLKWLPVAGCAALMMIGVWWLARPAPRPAPHIASLEPTTSGTPALGLPMAQDLPAAVLSPLNDEWRRLNLDWDNTARFLLANLP